jgi:hypothetical protein
MDVVFVDLWLSRVSSLRNLLYIFGRVPLVDERLVLLGYVAFTGTTTFFFSTRKNNRKGLISNKKKQWPELEGKLYFFWL